MMLGDPNREFKSLKLWTFGFDEEVVSPTTGRTNTKARTLGILATNMDQSFALAREKFPTARFTGCTMTAAHVHYIIDRPEVVAVANRLEQADAGST